MVHSREKSQFLHRERDVWDRLAEETWRREGLAAQLATARQEVAKLAPAAWELDDLRVWEKDAHDDACEAREKLMALIERARLDGYGTRWRPNGYGRSGMICSGP